MPTKKIGDRKAQPAVKKRTPHFLQISSEMAEIANQDIEELIAGMRKASKKILDTPGETKKYLLSTGFYTKSLKLKRRFL